MYKCRHADDIFLYSFKFNHNSCGLLIQSKRSQRYYLLPLLLAPWRLVYNIYAQIVASCFTGSWLHPRIESVAHYLFHLVCCYINAEHNGIMFCLSRSLFSLPWEWNDVRNGWDLPRVCLFVLSSSFLFQEEKLMFEFLWRNLFLCRKKESPSAPLRNNKNQRAHYLAVKRS